MKNNLDDEQIVIELRELIATYEQAGARLDAYCEAMKNIFLQGSCSN